MSSQTMTKRYADLVEQKLKEIFASKGDCPGILRSAMEYSLNAGGKRIRPVLMLEFYRLLGKRPEDIVNFACAIEMIHTYSLIHDDLPCMDDDDMRRGKPSCHIAFGEANALLAGDALLTLAFETAADISRSINPANAVKAINRLAQLSGMCGMVGGQVLDLESEGKNISKEQLERIQSGKTAALLKAPAEIACILANADEIQTNKAVEYCELLGRAFQIRDDILDVIADENQLGKPVGSDNRQNKNTYVTLMGLDNAQKETEKLSVLAAGCLEVFDGADDLRELVFGLSVRKF